MNCRAPDAPYKNYDCLDKYLGDGFFERFVNYYRLEWGHDAAPADPKAPPSRRPGWGDSAPQTAPPMPFTEWPYGGSTNIGTTRPGSVDSPFMVAIGNTELGKRMSDAHMQVYGWVNGGGNLSTNSVTPGRQLAGGLRLHAQHGAARPGRGLFRAPARHGADRSHRLGLPVLRHLR